MKLKDHINKAIKKYPTLYKAENYERSAIVVLEHLFLVIGNGFDWHDGYLCGDTLKPYGKEKSKPLPKNFFKKRDYRYHITKKYMYKATKKKPNIFSELPWKNEVVKRGNNYYFRQGKDVRGYTFSPYPICEYSAIVTMPKNVRSDWLEGAIQIVKLTLDYFNDFKKFQNNYYYPHKRRIESTRDDFLRLTKENRFKEVAVRYWGASLEDENNPERYVRKFWKKNKKQQLKYLQDFLKKWGAKNDA